MTRSARCRLFLPSLFLLGLPLAAGPQTPDAALVAKAKAIHERVITLDTHVDIDPRNFIAGPRGYTSALDTQVNLPKMAKGGLDAAFFVVYVGQGPMTREGYDKAYAADG
jgi:membrane dipeptidase